MKFEDVPAFEEKSRSENEIKRLLYVACTRAEQSLWLSSASYAKQPAGLSQYLPAFSRVEESPSGRPSDQTQSNEAVAQHAVVVHHYDLCTLPAHVGGNHYIAWLDMARTTSRYATSRSARTLLVGVPASLTSA